MTPVPRAKTHLGVGALTLILGGLQTIMPFSTDLYLPALPTIARELRVEPGAAQFTVAIFMIGVAFGQILYGPITDKYGRKTPLLVGLLIYILGSLMCALAPNITALIAGRFLQSLGASASAVITSAVVRDLWSGKTLADRLSLMMLVIGVAPLVAPSLGGLILVAYNWQVLFWFLMGFGVLIALTVVVLPETSSTQERAQTRLRDALGNYAALLHNIPFMLYVLTGACMVATLFAYIIAAPFMYIETLGVTPNLFAVLFSATALGFVGVSQINRVLLRRWSLLQVARGASIVVLGVALLLLTVTAVGWINVLTLTVLLFALTAALSCTFPNLAALAFFSVQERMGSASAVQGTTQSLVGGIAGVLVGALANGTMLPVICIIVIFAALGVVFLQLAQRAHNETEQSA